MAQWWLCSMAPAVPHISGRSVAHVTDRSTLRAHLALLRGQARGCSARPGSWSQLSPRTSLVPSWHSTAQRGMAQKGTAWHSTAQGGMAWHSRVRAGAPTLLALHAPATCL